MPVCWPTAAEDLGPGKASSSVPEKSESRQPGIVQNVELGLVRNPVERTAEDLDGVQRCEPKARRGQGEWESGGPR